MTKNSPKSNWHMLSSQETLTQLNVKVETGLSTSEADQRRLQYGPNLLKQEKKEPLWKIFIEHISEPMLLLLLGVGVLYFFFGTLRDTITIVAIVLLIVSIEIFNEQRAEKAIALLHKLAEQRVPVKRNGHIQEILSEDVVPGDILLLEVGEKVAADARLIESYSLSVNESLLTGESSTVCKETDTVLGENTPLAERNNLVFAGTTITGGRGMAVAIATGMDTELGHIADLTHQVKETETPLQKVMAELGRWMVWLALGFSVVIPLMGWLIVHLPFTQMLLTGLSLFFASVPEELPVIIAMVLALGGYHLSRQKAIVKRLRAIEALGATTVIATDKTGTLTENQTTVVNVFPESLRREILEVGLLCNDASFNGEDYRGDPIDIALIKAAKQAKLDISALQAANPLINEFCFDNTRKCASTVAMCESGCRVFTKGAPESVLSRSVHFMNKTTIEPLTDTVKTNIIENAEKMAREGLRVLAFARKETREKVSTQNEAESDLVFLGLVGLADPLRPEAKQAISECLSAGIRPIIISGDHPTTVKMIAAQVGLNNSNLLTGSELDNLSPENLQHVVRDTALFARTTPEHKLRIVESLQRNGELVAVTGDGINDAPAIAAANIGIAMGQTGTDVAREAADIVLVDDNFATIIRAIKEGRALFENLKKATRYYLACKVALISSMLLPIILFVPLPFAPVQIIFMELIMDLAASSGFAVEHAEPDLMQRQPRNLKEHFLNRNMIAGILASGAGVFAAVSVAYLVTWFNTGNLVQAQTMAFVTWLMGHVLMAFNTRSDREPLIRMGILSNKLMLYWGLAVGAFVLLIALVPGFQEITRTSVLSADKWILAIASAFIGTFWRELLKLLRPMFRNRS